MEVQQPTEPTLGQILNQLKLIQDTMLTISEKVSEQRQREKHFYSIEEAAEMLGVSELTLYRKCKSGAIPTKKIGTRKVIPASFFET